MFDTNKDGKDTRSNDGSHLVDDVKKMARNFKVDAKEAVSDARDDLEGMARRTGHQAREFADSAEHSLESAGETVALKIRNNPIQSSLIALGVGLVVGMFYRR